jgi:hypothetical protein
MQNKKLIIILGIVVIVVGAAAFIAGRLLNQGVGPMGLGLPFGRGGGPMTVSIRMEPASELPKTQPNVVGQFEERRDNIVIVSSISMKAGGGGVVVSVNKDDGGGDNEGETTAGSPADNSGPKMEVVVTKDTIIYKDTTEPPAPSGGNQNIQQTVGEGTLDDLTSNSFITVWGRKSGDRIIAEVLLYSQPVIFKRPG